MCTAIGKFDVMFRVGGKGGKGGVARGVKLCAGESAYDEGSMGVWTISDIGMTKGELK